MTSEAESIISGYFQLSKHSRVNSKLLLSLVQARFGGQGLGVVCLSILFPTLACWMWLGSGEGVLAPLLGLLAPGREVQEG